VSSSTGNKGRGLVRMQQRAGDRGKENPGLAWPGISQGPPSHLHIGACYITPMLLPLTTGVSAPPACLRRNLSPVPVSPIALKLMRLLTIQLHFH
jgi:hypothetical protein